MFKSAKVFVGIVVAVMSASVLHISEARAKESAWGESDIMQIVGAWPLPYLGYFVVQGDLAFVASRWGLVVLDLAEPAGPAIIAQSYVSLGLESAVAKSGDYIYLATKASSGDIRLMCYDVSDPAAPVLAGECPYSRRAWQIVALDQSLLILSEAAVDVIDISTPTSPFVRSSLPMSAGGRGALGNQVLFVVDGADVKAIDVSDLDNLTVLASYDQFVEAKRVAISGDMLYVLDHQSESEFDVTAVDVSNPEVPVVMGTYVGPQSIEIAVLGTAVYVTGYGGVSGRVINFANPQAPVYAGPLAGEADRVLAENNRVYFYSDYFLEQYDAVDPLSPLLLDRFQGPGSFSVHDIAVDQNFAAIACGQLYLVDITDPSRPEFLGSLGIPSLGALAVDIQGSFAYVADGYAIDAVDISDPSQPTIHQRLIMNYDNPGLDVAPQFVVAEEDFVLASGGAGIQTIDIADPLNPVKNPMYSTPELKLTYGANIAADHAYVVAQNFASTVGIAVVNLSQPALPELSGMLAYAAPLWDTPPVIQDNYLHFFDHGGTLTLADVTDPNSPELRGNVMVGTSWGTGMIVRGDYVCLAGSDLAIVDKYSPQTPQVVDNIAFGGAVEAIACDTNFVYQAVNGALLISTFPQYSVTVGDCDGSGIVNISDAVFVISYIFSGGSTPLPYRSGDVNCDRLVTISDAVYLITWIFAGGTAPCQQ